MIYFLEVSLIKSKKKQAKQKRETGNINGINH
ncbi:hypothetical protein IX324_003051 [Bacteroides pyogenes]|nr:hypothetical protein [Bacteroides pyogenes]